LPGRAPALYNVAMAIAVESAVKAYIRAWAERDPAARAALIASCFAADGRLVGPAKEIHGRAELAQLMARFSASRRWFRIRLTSAIDVRDRAFRFSGVVECDDGTVAESFDSGIVNAAGQIELLMTFAGPLSPPSELFEV
jgi:hypothetical protein